LSSIFVNKFQTPNSKNFISKSVTLTFLQVHLKTFISMAWNLLLFSVLFFFIVCVLVFYVCMYHFMVHFIDCCFGISLPSFLYWDQHIPVAISSRLWAGCLRNLDLIPGRGEKFFLFSTMSTPAVRHTQHFMLIWDSVI
jgi:hypothetical protein